MQLVNKSAIRICKSLEHALYAKARLGESRHEAKAAARDEYLTMHGTLAGYNPAKAPGIYSVGTLRAYLQEMPAFALFCAEHGAKRISAITEALAEGYLRQCAESQQSAWTIAKKASAINKALGLEVSSLRLGLPQRHKADIKRCRTATTPKGNRNYDAYQDHITFARATGVRRMSITRVRPCDCVRDERGSVIGVHVTEKGGKHRVAPVLTALREQVTLIVDKAARERGEDMVVFARYDRHIPNHRYRAEYAGLLLHQLEAERAAGIAPFGGAYPLSAYAHPKGVDKRRGPVTQGHDTDLLSAVSGALGHNRVEVVLRHYLYTY